MKFFPFDFFYIEYFIRFFIKARNLGRVYTVFTDCITYDALHSCSQHKCASACETTNEQVCAWNQKLNTCSEDQTKLTGIKTHQVKKNRKELFRNNSSDLLIDYCMTKDLNFRNIPHAWLNQKNLSKLLNPLLPQHWLLYQLKRRTTNYCKPRSQSLPEIQNWKPKVLFKTLKFQVSLHCWCSSDAEVFCLKEITK